MVPNDCKDNYSLFDIFPDAILLDEQFLIKKISAGLLALLNYHATDLAGQHVSVLSADKDFGLQLKDNFSEGVFRGRVVKLKSGCKSDVEVRISGFYLNRITNNSQNIILLITGCEELNLLRGALHKKTEELKRFLYRAYHDLRGPIATIRGLVNLVNKRADDKEIDLFFDLISTQAEKLDQELITILKSYESMDV